MTRLKGTVTQLKAERLKAPSSTVKHLEQTLIASDPRAARSSLSSLDAHTHAVCVPAPSSTVKAPASTDKQLEQGHAQAESQTSPWGARRSNLDTAFSRC